MGPRQSCRISGQPGLVSSRSLSHHMYSNPCIMIAGPPSEGTVQPMPYRSPEVLFNLQWSKAVDIWGWGMVVRISHLRVTSEYSDNKSKVSAYDSGVLAPRYMGSLRPAPRRDYRRG